MSGVDRIPLRIPEQWDPKWFRDFVRDVLAPADARNALGQAGITVSGGPNSPAIIEGLGGVTASDTDTVDITVVGQHLTIDVRKQMSLTSDSAGMKLSGDQTTPAANCYYGTDRYGVRGYHSAYPAFWITQLADRTLTSSTSPQKIFDQAANGSLLLPSGVYLFDLFLYMTGMDAAAGNATINMLGSGSATTDRWGWQVWGLDDSSPLGWAARSGAASVTPGVAALPPATGTGMVASARGLFRVSASGTIVPSVALDTAAAATVKAGSWFAVRQIGESADAYLGAWS